MTEQAIPLHQLSPTPGSRRRRKRLGDGQGSGHGQTSTKGQKGQRARSGDGKLVGFEGGQTPLFRRVPKRGFGNGAFRKTYQIVSLAQLERIFGNQKEVKVAGMKMHGLIHGKDCRIKVLADGELKHPLKIEAHAFSKGAKEKIEKAGGTAEVIVA